MKRLRKILLWVVLPLVALLVIAVVVVTMLVSSSLTRDAIAERIESEKNCRVLLDSVDASLLGGKIVLNNLVLLERDEHADAGTPLDDRPPPAASQTGIRVKRVEMNAKLIDLLKKKVTVHDLTFDGLDVSFLINRENEDDSTTLDGLFDPPQTISGKPNNDYAEKKKRREVAKARSMLKPDDPAREELDTFNIEELPLPATMDKLVIKNSSVFMKIRKDKTRIRLYDINLTLTDLDIDPDDLANHNKARLGLDCRLDVTGRDKVTVYADLDLHGEGDIAPFDTATGLFNPNLITRATIKEGSEIFSLPLIKKLASALDKLKKAGLDVTDLEDTLVVKEDATLRLGWRDAVLQTADPVSVNLNGHHLQMEAGSWLHTGSNEHKINGELTFSQNTSDSAFGRANAFLAKLELLDEATVKQIADLLFSPVTKNGRLYVPFVSSGDFGRPKVRPRVELVDLSDLLKDEAKEGALNLLDQLIRNRKSEADPAEK